jgi:hypothetical protein
VLVDVSEPSHALLWEISTLKADIRSRWILVGEQERLARWVKAVADKDAPAGRQLRDLLDGENILSYSIDGSSKKRFARALRFRLEHLR